ncbi:DUF2062 domain-containing protein [Paenibacillus hemerocallicola]|uniref:DUF2062 domain-containing protein n=1 Tax=Paenibacillus hemerocallicola TaxID=1172614 RepID=A0A5C4SZ62_9BACL|nr:DUF2062 domain-containing protein [Paenibacillus hemerocallicola]TNJ61963.1 DUF2062 domain-containing protein [Paenibacillus hemerocallicola]
MPVQVKRSARTANPSRLTRTFRGIARWFKYKYLLLSRAKGGAAKVAAGFSIGLAVEMFTLPTFGLAFFLIFPLVYIFRANFAGALIGFVFGKIIYIPLAFVNAKVGGLIVPDRFNEWISFLPYWIEKMLYVNAKLIVGGIVDGTLIALLLYFPLKQLLQLFTSKRSEKRRVRREQLVLKESNN